VPTDPQVVALRDVVREHHARVLPDAAEDSEQNVAFQRLRFVDLTARLWFCVHSRTDFRGLLCAVHVRIIARGRPWRRSRRLEFMIETSASHQPC
jgi:hypothetical protein